MPAKRACRWLCAAAIALFGCAENADSDGPTPQPAGAGGLGGVGAVGGEGGGTGGNLGGSGGDAIGGNGGSAGGGGGAGGAPDTCGNGTIEAPELCDGTNFGDKTCATFGLDSGELICNDFCGVVLTSCTPEELCGDQVDNDDDGLFDCADDGCETSVFCTLACFAPSVTFVPGFEFGDTVGGASLLQPSCTADSGPEWVLQVEAVDTGDLGLQLNGGANFSLSVRQTCDDAATELGCANNAVNDTEALNVPVVAGETYFIVVDGINPSEAGFFDLSLDMVFPETSCQDFLDDDIDAFVDCDDPTACQGSAQCVPGAGGVGSACQANTACTATGGDPACLPPADGFIGGYCSEFCNLAADDCTGDGVCVDMGPSVNGLCLDKCTTVADCRPGYVCTDEGYPELVCAPPGELNCNDYGDNDSDDLVDCGDPSSCSASFSCVPGPGPTGSGCQINNQCQAAGSDPLCISDFEFGFPGGYCSEWCNFGPGECVAGSICVDWFFFPGNAGQCLQTCTGPADCAFGYTCQDIGEPEDVCIP